MNGALYDKHVIVPDGRHGRVFIQNRNLDDGSVVTVVRMYGANTDVNEYYSLGDLKFVIPDGKGGFNVMGFDQMSAKEADDGKLPKKIGYVNHNDKCSFFVVVKGGTVNIGTLSYSERWVDIKDACAVIDEINRAR